MYYRIVQLSQEGVEYEETGQVGSIGSKSVVLCIGSVLCDTMSAARCHMVCGGDAHDLAPGYPSWGQEPFNALKVWICRCIIDSSSVLGQRWKGPAHVLLTAGCIICHPEHVGDDIAQDNIVHDELGRTPS